MHREENKAIVTVSSRFDGLPKIRKFVRDSSNRISGGSFSEEDITILELAATEVATNIIRHAYHGDEHQSVRLEALHQGDRLVLRFLHRGKFFQPDQIPEPDFNSGQEGGWGLFIIEQSVDEMTYTLEEDGSCVIELKKGYKKGVNNEQEHDP